MKKATMMMVAVLFACGVQAVSVSWNISGLRVANTDNTMSAVNLVGAVVYGFVGDADAASSAAAAAASKTFGTWMAGVAPANMLGSATTGSTGGALKSGQGSFAVGASVNVFLVVFDTASSETAANFLVTTVQNKIMPSTNPIYGFGAPAGQYVPATWTDVVPEPTSMALLALGAAALGLRRKFRK